MSFPVRPEVLLDPNSAYQVINGEPPGERPACLPPAIIPEYFTTEPHDYDSPNPYCSLPRRSKPKPISPDAGGATSRRPVSPDAGGATSRRPVSPGRPMPGQVVPGKPKLHVWDHNKLIQGIRRFFIDAARSAFGKIRGAPNAPILHSELRSIREAVYRSFGDPVYESIRDEAIVALTERMEAVIHLRMDDFDYPAYPADQQAMNLLQKLSREREIEEGRLPEATPAEARRVYIKVRHKRLYEEMEQAAALNPDVGRGDVPVAPSGSSPSLSQHTLARLAGNAKGLNTASDAPHPASGYQPDYVPMGEHFVYDKNWRDNPAHAEKPRPAPELTVLRA